MDRVFRTDVKRNLLIMFAALFLADNFESDYYPPMELGEWIHTFRRELVELCFVAYAIGLATATTYTYFFIPRLLVHGREGVMEPKIPKRYFIVFYAIGVVMAYKTFFGVFCIRRMLETYFYTKTTRSWMNVLQFIHGCIYYSVLGQYFNFKSHVKGTIWFHTMNCILNVVQGIIHYRLYICKDRTLSIMHYIVEVLIYFNYLWRFRDATMLFIFLYVCMFAYATVGLRMTAGGRF